MLGDFAALLDPGQPACWIWCGAAARAGRKHDRPVGVCGEAAADPALAPVLVGLGVTSLSEAPNSLPGVRASLAAHTLDHWRPRTSPWTHLTTSTAPAIVREALA